jgi:hypothetical protein
MLGDDRKSLSQEQQTMITGQQSARERENRLFTMKKGNTIITCLDRNQIISKSSNRS